MQTPIKHVFDATKLSSIFTLFFYISIEPISFFNSNKIMLSPWTSRSFLYASVGLTAFAVYKHTSICINDIFPILNKSLGAGDPITFSAKSNYLQASASLVTIGAFPFRLPKNLRRPLIRILYWFELTAILQLKWAKYGLTEKYDKILLAWYGLYSIVFGIGYVREGWYLPLIPMWGIPTLTIASQL